MVHENGHDVRVLMDDGIYTESPRWHGGAVWFSDIGAGQVCRLRPDGGKEVVLSGIRTPSGLGWTESGDLLVASIEDSALYRVAPGSTPVSVCGPAEHGTHATNDMATFGSRSYVSCSGRIYEKGDGLAELSLPVGKVLLFDHATGDCRIVADGMKMPNGLDLSADGRTLFVVEVFASRILRFDIGDDGTLSEPRVFCEPGHSMDGLCVDAEGGLWVGGTGTNRFQRIDAHGRLREAIAVPGWTCIACTLGGPDGHDLFMVVSRMEDADAIFDGRAKSRLLQARVAVPAKA